SRGSGVTMGSMSASDAAPLPRLGEVYFDVRGESRSMRLSWYADTGVAVFSIWQGGTCTGTFRLPIADLPRMVAALQRGPHGDARGPRDARGAAEQQGRTDQRGGHAREPRPEPDTGYSDPGYPGAYGEEPAPDYPDHPGQGHRAEPATEAYREGQADEYRRAGAHGRHEEEPPGGYRNGSPPGGYRGQPGGDPGRARRVPGRAGRAPGRARRAPGRARRGVPQRAWRRVRGRADRGVPRRPDGPRLPGRTGRALPGGRVPGRPAHRASPGAGPAH